MDTPNPLTPMPIRSPSAGIIIPDAPTRPPVLNSAPDALALLKSLRRRWALALGLGLLLAGTLGPAAWFLVPRAKYRAVATLRVSSHPKRIVFESSGNRSDAATYQKTQTSILKNPYVLSHALNKPDVAALPTVKGLLLSRVDPEEWLQQNLKAAFPGNSEILEISLSGDHPEDLATIINAITDSYMTLVVDEERKERLGRLEKLKELWQRYHKELELKRKSLKEVAAAVGSHDEMALATAQQFKAAQLGLAQGELIRTRNELLKSEAKLSALEAEHEPKAMPMPSPAVMQTVPDAVLNEQVEQEPAVADLKAQVERLARQYWDVERVVRKKADPALLAVQRKWQEASGQLDRLRAKLREHSLAQLGVAPGGGSSSERAMEFARLRADVEVSRAYQEALSADVDRLQKEVRDLNEGGIDLEAEREEISIATDFARKVGTEVEYLQVELDAPDRIVVLSAAKPPRTKDESRKIKAGGVAALGSFAMALFGVSFWEFRARRVDAAEMVSGLGLTLVGALPALPGRALGGQAALPDRRWQNLLIESIDATRTMLLHASRTDSIRVVMIASASKGEGKTSLSCHLAASLARSGRKTLLIDGDMRNPAVHRLFDLPEGPGLCELLRGEVEVGDVVWEAPTGGLEIIPAGRCNASSLQALAQDNLRVLLSGLRGHYDFIIVDSAPILPVVDSLLIAQNVDGVLISVMSDVSRVPEVYSVRERFMKLGVKVLGAVISGVQNSRQGYGYGYGHVHEDEYAPEGGLGNPPPQ